MVKCDPRHGVMHGVMHNIENDIKAFINFISYMFEFHKVKIRENGRLVMANIWRTYGEHDYDISVSQQT